MIGITFIVGGHLHTKASCLNRGARHVVGFKLVASRAAERSPPRLTTVAFDSPVTGWN